jgi:hypothetical protein
MNRRLHDIKQSESIQPRSIKREDDDRSRDDIYKYIDEQIKKSERRIMDIIDEKIKEFEKDINSHIVEKANEDHKKQLVVVKQSISKEVAVIMAEKIQPQLTKITKNVEYLNFQNMDSGEMINEYRSGLTEQYKGPKPGDANQKKITGSVADSKTEMKKKLFYFDDTDE